MILTQRLLKIAQMVEYNTAIDVGTDHAKLPVYLVKNGICRYVIASDIADGPVNACRTTVNLNDVSRFVEIRQGDGLKTTLPNETETIIIAGMGGDLISTILDNSRGVAKSAKEIIVQPMTHIPQLREFFYKNNYRIIDEVLVKERDKIYTIIKVADGVNQYKDSFDFIVSPLLIQNKDVHLQEYILKLLNKYRVEICGLNNASIQNKDLLDHIIDIVNKLERLYEVTKNY